MVIVSSRRHLIVAVVVGALLLAAAGAAGCGREEASGPMKVAASIVPLADFCREVGGGLVEVELMVPPGASPHTYEPTSSQMKFLSDAKVLVLNGLELETWVTDVVKKVDNPDLVEVVAGDSIPGSDLIRAAGEEHGLYDPHVWLDPNLAIYEAEAIRDGFIEADPGNRKAYTDNALRYVGELKALDARIREEAPAFTGKGFVAFHPSLTYFARRYGLEQVGVIEELPGKEPSAREISKLIDKIRESGVTVVLAEPQFSPKVAETIATEAAVTVTVIDPLGDPDNPETNTYIKLMAHNVGTLLEAMR